MRDTWVSSVSKMSADELQTLMRAHYPRSVEARRKKASTRRSRGIRYICTAGGTCSADEAFGGRRQAQSSAARPGAGRTL